MVRKVIQQHISSRALMTLRASDESDRTFLRAWADEIDESAP
jgi:hypothetical protein